MRRGVVINTLAVGASIAVLEWAFIFHTLNSNLSFLATALVQFLAIFWAFYLSYQYAARSQRKQSRRIEKFTLGILWHELLINSQVIAQIKNNFKFVIDREPANLKYTAIRMQLLKLLADKIQDGSFEGAQNSGGITEIKSDEVFNSIIIAFENCRYLQLNLLVVAHDFSLKYELFTDPAIEKTLTEEVRQDLINAAKQKIPQAEAELRAAEKTVNYALGQTDARLNSLGVKAELIERPLERTS